MHYYHPNITNHHGQNFTTLSIFLLLILLSFPSFQVIGVPALWSEERLLSIKGTQIEMDARMMRAEWVEAAEEAVATHPGTPIV